VMGRGRSLQAPVDATEQVDNDNLIAVFDF
jgi:hypothetical protein